MIGVSVCLQLQEAVFGCDATGRAAVSECGVGVGVGVGVAGGQSRSHVPSRSS